VFGFNFDLGRSTKKFQQDSNPIPRRQNLSDERIQTPESTFDYAHFVSTRKRVGNDVQFALIVRPPKKGNGTGIDERIATAKRHKRTDSVRVAHFVVVRVKLEIREEIARKERFVKPRRSAGCILSVSDAGTEHFDPRQLPEMGGRDVFVFRLAFQTVPDGFISR
jgi:hypothetical protein